jgi:hypothetical protein
MKPEGVYYYEQQSESISSTVQIMDYEFVGGYYAGEKLS